MSEGRFVITISKTHLLGEGVPVEELHRLQMGMELLDHGELLFQQVLDDVSHRHVVG